MLKNSRNNESSVLKVSAKIPENKGMRKYLEFKRLKY